MWVKDNKATYENKKMTPTIASEAKTIYVNWKPASNYEKQCEKEEKKQQ